MLFDSKKVLISISLCVGSMISWAQIPSSSSSWGNSGYVHDYYYGETAIWQSKSMTIFHYDDFPLESMASVSIQDFNTASIQTAASYIQDGYTIQEYDFAISSAPNRAVVPGVPDVPVPISDGWDVYAMLLLLATGFAYKQYYNRLHGYKEKKYCCPVKKILCTAQYDTAPPKKMGTVQSEVSMTSL